MGKETGSRRGENLEASLDYFGRWIKEKIRIQALV